MRTSHLSVQKGKRVLIILRTGERIIAKFVEKKNARIILDIGEIQTKDIRVLSLYKGEEKI